ncbi:MAG: chlorite dismutase family protein [Actinomycetota bacterium]|nr:chlorite dismutase family protein [Actinomycetota bacterium]
MSEEVLPELSSDDETFTPTEGLSVLHLFCKANRELDKDAIIVASKALTEPGYHLVPFSMLGHKAQIGFLAYGPNFVKLKQFQRDIERAGLEVVDSYVSMTEVSEYAKDLPADRRAPRLYPVLPPKGMYNICFYGMSKQRGEKYNWYTLPYEEREKLMFGHGASGRAFAGRVIQLVTGSTGVDDYEWGVTLFATKPDFLKEVVYTMRYDEGSALYGEFGPFYTGVIGNLESVLENTF